MYIDAKIWPQDKCLEFIGYTCTFFGSKMMMIIFYFLLDLIHRAMDISIHRRTDSHDNLNIYFLKQCNIK